MTAPQHRPRRVRSIAALATAVSAAAASALLAPVGLAEAASTSLVISEVYGGGGNTGAPYSHDFIEISNVGTTTVDVSGWSVQYASAAGTAYTATPLRGQIPAGATYLVQQAKGSSGGTALPAPDAVGSTTMAASAGKVALVSSSTPLSCGADCDGAAGVADFVGWGTANDFEGQPAPAGSNTTSVSRTSSPDSDNNAADFTAGAPSPTSCGEACAPSAPPPAVSVAQIQGAAHLSPLRGQSVTAVAGVVTARKGNGFYLQDPRGPEAPGYVAGASSAVFVFTGSAPAADLVPGTAVRVDGAVTEFRQRASGLTVTQITSPTTTVVAGGQPLPALTRVEGPNGDDPQARNVPAAVIDDDAPAGGQINVETQGSYDAASDGIDFWESLEGMRVGLVDAAVVGPTNDFGETPVVPAGSLTRTARGGIVLQAGDANPERVLLEGGLGGTVATSDVGDAFAGTTEGILDYEFSNFHLVATATPTHVDGGLTREVTSPAAYDELSVATFNVENLDPGDPQAKFDALADIVVDNMQAPDLVTLEEVQDNDGATGGTASPVTSADATLAKLVDAITAAGGPAYTWQQIDPVDDAEGGEPGGNIRVAFLVQEGTPLRFVERDRGDSTTDTDVVSLDGSAALTHSPGRVAPGDPAWASARVPLAGEFTFGGQKVFVVANHWSSKGGDGALFGPQQPPTQSTEAKRIQQAQVVRDFVDEILAVDPDANVVVAGDLNDFEYSRSVMTLRGSGDRELLDLPATLPDAERYTYVFEGNSQVLDHLLVSGGAARQGYDYDVVHVNAEFADQVSDHDPQVLNLRLGLPATTLTANAAPSPVVHGGTSTVSGTLHQAASGDPVTGATVELQARNQAGQWQPTGLVTSTDAEGRYAFSVRPDATTAYRAVFAGDRDRAGSTSPATEVAVATRVTLRVSSTSVRKAESVLFTGLVAPNHAGQSVQVQRFLDGAWATVATARLDSDSLYAYTWTPSRQERKGTTTWRVVKPADGDHATGTSPTVDITVR